MNYKRLNLLWQALGGLAADALFAALLIAYLKLVEEKELQLRFGSEYVEYKQKTPFMIPIKLGRAGSKGQAAGE